MKWLMLESVDVKRLICVSELRPCGARSQTRLLTVGMLAETRTAAISWALWIECHLLKLHAQSVERRDGWATLHLLLMFLLIC